MKAFFSLLPKAYLRFVAAPGLLFILLACQKEMKYNDPLAGDHNLTLRFRAVVDTGRLAYGKTYSNPFKESYTVKTFKFYVYGIELTNTDSNRMYQINRDSFYLVDFADTNNLATLKLPVLPYTYNRISFIVGVDSAHNVSGAQMGALDPVKGMFWTWNTGYIMAKLEGNSPVAQTPNNAFEYHIGGFKGADNVMKRISLLFPAGRLLDVRSRANSELTITANVNAWFSSPHDIRLNTTPTCMTPGTLSKQIAENYSKMFTVTDIRNAQ